MKTFDRRGWTPITAKVFEVHIYRNGPVGMLVRYEDDEPEPSLVAYFVWGDPDVRFDSHGAALQAHLQRNVMPVSTSKEVH